MKLIFLIYGRYILSNQLQLQVLIKEFFQCFRFIIGGQSVECEEAPSCGGRVRAVHGPSCQIVARNVFFRKGFF